MRPSRHAIASLSLGALFWFFTKSFYAGLLCFLSGLLIDGDHLLEYVLHHGIRGMTYEKVCDACEQTAAKESELGFKRVFLVLHSWELVALGWLAAFITGNIYIIALVAGYSLHIILDVVSNPIHPSSYFMLVRMAKKFNSDRLFSSRNKNKTGQEWKKSI